MLIVLVVEGNSESAYAFALSARFVNMRIAFSYPLASRTIPGEPLASSLLDQGKLSITRTQIIWLLSFSSKESRPSSF